MQKTRGWTRCRLRSSRSGVFPAPPGPADRIRDLFSSSARLDRPASLRGGLSTPGPDGPSGRDDVLVYRGCCVLWGVLCSVRSASAARFWSCRAERTLKALPPSLALGQGEVESSPLPGPAGTVRECWVRGDVSTSALHRRASGRHDVGFGGGVLCSREMALPSAPWSCRAERGGVETSPWACQERTNPLGPWRSLHAASIGVETLVETTCWSVRRALLCRGMPPPPASGRVERSGSAVETPPWACWNCSGMLDPFGDVGSVRECRCRGGLSASGRRGPFGRDDVLVCGHALFCTVCLPRPPPGHVERNAL